MGAEEETLSRNETPRLEGLEPAEISRLYAEHAQGLRRFAIGVLRDRDAAEDVVQAVFAIASERGGETKCESRKAWLFRVAMNLALQHKRKVKTQREANKRLFRSDDSWKSTPDDELVRGETVQQVRTALSQLPKEQRDVVRMRIYEEKTFAQIADELNLPLGTVLTRMRLGLRKLRARLSAG